MSDGLETDETCGLLGLPHMTIRSMMSVSFGPMESADTAICKCDPVVMTAVIT